MDPIQSISNNDYEVPKTPCNSPIYQRKRSNTLTPQEAEKIKELIKNLNLFKGQKEA